MVAFNKFDPFIKMGNATWIVANWYDFAGKRSKQPQSMILRRLNKEEVDLLHTYRNDEECFAVVSTCLKKRLTDPDLVGP